MSWTYSQRGTLSKDGSFVSGGYSGIGDGLNNHADEGVANVGPIPLGKYSIGSAFTHPECGPLTMRLTPMPGTETYGRDGFCIHGDTQSMNHTASHGCVILQHDVRVTIDSSDDKTLEVVL